MIKYVLISLIVFGFFGCLDTKKKKDNKTQRGVIFVSNIDLTKLTHNAHSSNYYYPIQITQIDFKIVKHAFEVSNDKYDVPKLINGLKTIIKFKIKNPYNKEKLVPLSSYFFITKDDMDLYIPSYSGNDRFSTLFKYNDYSIIYKDKNVTDLYDERINNEYCLKFKPNEVKEFKIIFEPIEITNKITFIGFIDDKNGRVDYIERGIEIDVKTKKIIRQVVAYH